MLAKIKDYYLKTREHVSQLRDIRVVGLLLFLFVVLMVSWSGVKVINTNYELQRQIAQLEQENELQRLANENLKLQNRYFDTPQYLELAARESFGLAAPGETVFIVPRAVALKYTVDLPHEVQKQAAEDKRPAYQRNFQAWMDFFFHRNNLED
jgi:cell division protein FtsB